LITKEASCVEAAYLDDWVRRGYELEARLHLVEVDPLLEVSVFSHLLEQPVALGLDFGEPRTELLLEVEDVFLEDAEETVDVVVFAELDCVFGEGEVVALREELVGRQVALVVAFEVFLEEAFGGEFFVVLEVVDVLVWDERVVVCRFVLHDPLEVEEFDGDLHRLVHHEPVHPA
jgi:hypothetical protein